MTDTDKLYKIKPLTWAKWASGEWQADTSFGTYTVKKHRWQYCFDAIYDSGESHCASIEAGKAAAEAHWRERILPMLEEVE